MKISAKVFFDSFIIILALIFSTNFLQSTQLETIFFQVQILYLGSMILFIFFYIFHCLKIRDYDKTNYFFISLIFLIPIYSSIISYINFSQPQLYGFLSLRSWFLCITGIWLYYRLINESIYFNTVKSAFIFMCWASIILFSFYFMVEYSGTSNTFVKSTGFNDKYRGVRFVFESFFILFGCIYYFIKYNQEKKWLNLIYLIVFISFLLLIIQRRTDIIFMSSTFLVYYLFEVKGSTKIFKLTRILFFLTFCYFLIQIINPEYLFKMSELFDQMFQVIYGIESLDTSANIRIFSTYIVLDYWNQFPLTFWFGAGKLSNQWNYGFSDMFGYFYPQDIGVLGGIFIFGIIPSIFIFLIPLFITYKVQKKVNLSDDIFSLSLKYFLIYKMMSSVQGSYFFNTQEYIIIVFLLMAYLKLKDKDTLNQKNKNFYASK